MLEADTSKTHKSQTHKAGDYKSNSQPSQRSRNVGVTQFFANRSESYDCQEKPKTGAEAEHDRLTKSVFPFNNKKRTTKDRTVHRNKRQKDT